jgi:serine/threonine protein kinase
MIYVSQCIPFNLPTNPIPHSDSDIKVKSFPKDGSLIQLGNGTAATLGEKVSAGGEGVIYAVVGNSSLVCKIYHPEKLTKLRQEKITLMLSREVKADGICWPIDIVKNSYGEFVGYIMPRASGKPMQTSMFIKPQLLKNFPTWKRLNLVKITLSFLEKMDYLHSMNIIVGDINPLNVLVENNGKIWFVDTDSYQIENFSCPVGTVNFTAPEIQGKDYSSFMRTKQHELFAVATMLFMTLLPGKPPYSQQGGESQSDNIKKMNFSYWCEASTESNAPEGPWTFIWANLSRNLKTHFCQTFKQNKRPTIAEWKKAMTEYALSITQGNETNELFPVTFKISDPFQAECGKCGSITVASRSYVKKMQDIGKDHICAPCLRGFKLERLVRESKSNKQQVVAYSGSVAKQNYGRNGSSGGSGGSANGGIYYGNKNNTTTVLGGAPRINSPTQIKRTQLDSSPTVIDQVFRLIGICVVIYISFKLIS